MRVTAPSRAVFTQNCSRASGRWGRAPPQGKASGDRSCRRFFPTAEEGEMKHCLKRSVLITGVVLATTLRIAAAAPQPKVTICHFPPGNPANVQVITVGAPAVATHVAHHNDAVCAGGNSDCCAGETSLCTNFATDTSNCGGCGVACARGETCSDGRVPPFARKVRPRAAARASIRVTTQEIAANAASCAWRGRSVRRVRAPPTPTRNVPGRPARRSRRAT